MNDPQEFHQIIADAIEHLDPGTAVQATRTAIASGIDAMAIVNQGIDTGMTRVGERYQADEYHLPELLFAEEVMRQCLNTINDMTKDTETSGFTADAEARLIELSRSWVGPLSSCVTRLFRYDEERKKNKS